MIVGGVLFLDRVANSHLHHLAPHEPGNPYDNALAESFVATLKTECFGDSIPPTKAVAKLMIFDYIETFYNTRRRHSALDVRVLSQRK